MSDEPAEPLGDMGIPPWLPGGDGELGCQCGACREYRRMRDEESDDE